MDTLEFLLVALVTPANADDGTHAPEVLEKVSASHLSRLDEIRGDGKYNNQALDRWMAEREVGYRMTVVERTNACNGKYRRKSKDYKGTPARMVSKRRVNTAKYCKSAINLPGVDVCFKEFHFPAF